MYQNVFTKKIKTGYEVHIWDDKIGYQKVSYKAYAYKKSPSGMYNSIYGDKLKKVKYWTDDDVRSGNIFESDVPMETRVLIDMYSESNEISEGQRTVFFDIEVEVKDGFPDPHRADNKITAIALYDKVVDDYTCFILGDVKDYQNGNTTIESFRSEEELLQRFYQKYLEINPTILSGWNIDGFDIPYLYNRTTRVLGSQFANSLSPIGHVYYNERQLRFKIAGVSCLDYIRLYKLYTYTQQSSYRLDFIGQLEVGIGKIEYEGTLQNLYETDIKKYIEYNLNDVKIVKALDDKLKFIELARGVAHIGHIGYEDVFLSSRYLEGAILVHMRKLGLVAPNKSNKRIMNDGDDKFSGAFVKEPIPGRYDWVYDLDLTSMYPSVIMSLNISPETKLGKLDGWDVEEYINGVTKTYPFQKNNRFKSLKLPEFFDQDDLKEILDNNKISISTNGVLYKNNKQGLIPAMLSKWFDERVEYKNLMKKYSDEGDLEQSDYFKRRQHVQKIILNSLYGVLGLPVFRFYDIDNAEATTTTGVNLIKFTEKIGNYYYNKELGDDVDYCIYTDTDSVFYSAVPLIKHRNPSANTTDNEYMTLEILKIASEVQNFINESYNFFAKKFLNCDEHRFDIKQEVIAKSAFWVAKKRYGQWIINDGGVVCDKLDVKGLDIVRSNFPTAMRKLMKNVLRMLLSNEDKKNIDDVILLFKKEMKIETIDNIALPTGVRNIKKYTKIKRNKFKTKQLFSEVAKGTPIHVKSAVIYNDLLVYYKLNDVEKISTGNKIKWVYLKQNPLSIKTIAFKGYEDPPEIMDFINQYIDYDKIFESVLVKKIKMFYDALNWNMPLEEENTLARFF